MCGHPNLFKNINKKNNQLDVIQLTGCLSFAIYFLLKNIKGA